MQDIKAVIFDLDGTLYDNKGFIARLILGEHGYLYTLIRERFARRKLRGVDFETSEGFYAEFFRLIWPWNPKRAEKWYWEHYMPLQVRILQNYKAFPHMKERIADLHSKGVKMAVFSDYDLPIEKVEALGLDAKMFDAVVSAPSLGGLKPSKLAAMRLMDMLGEKVEQTLVVGDRKGTDGALAKAIGAEFELV